MSRARSHDENAMELPPMSSEHLHPTRPLVDGAAHRVHGDVVDDTFGLGARSSTVVAASRADGLTQSQMRDLITTLPLIEQAKGVLMGHYGIDEDQAFAVLRRWSAARHLKVREVCARLLDAVVAQPRPDLAEGLQALLGPTEA